MTTVNQNNVIEFTLTKSAEQVFLERLSMVGAEDRDEVLRRISDSVAAAQQGREAQISA